MAWLVETGVGLVVGAGLGAAGAAIWFEGGAGAGAGADLFSLASTLGRLTACDRAACRSCLLSVDWGVIRLAGRSVLFVGADLVWLEEFFSWFLLATILCSTFRKSAGLARAGCSLLDGFG